MLLPPLVWQTWNCIKKYHCTMFAISESHSFLNRSDIQNIWKGFIKKMLNSIFLFFSFTVHFEALKKFDSSFSYSSWYYKFIETLESVCSFDESWESFHLNHETFGQYSSFKCSDYLLERFVLYINRSFWNIKVNTNFDLSFSYSSIFQTERWLSV